MTPSAKYKFVYNIVFIYLFLLIKNLKTMEILVRFLTCSGINLRTYLRTYLRSEMPNGKMKKKIGTFLLYSYLFLYTLCQGSSGPFYIVIYYIKWVTTSWTYCNKDPPAWGFVVGDYGSFGSSTSLLLVVEHVHVQSTGSNLGLLSSLIMRKNGLYSGVHIVHYGHTPSSLFFPQTT